MSLRQSKIDLPVLIIFFNRPYQLSQVFEQVRLAAPSKLYLYQDGARDSRPEDHENIEACRKIVSEVDWCCEVNRLYQNKNYGCDPSEYIAQRWMFSREEYGVVLEDDDIPSQSFFPYCKELLERYKDDERVNIVCGMNNEGVTEEIESSYLFTIHGSIWGWASWQRVVMSWNSSMPYLDDTDARRLIEENYGGESCLRLWETLRSTGRAHYEAILGSESWVNGRLNIVPKYNMITSAGISEDSTHSVSDIKKLDRHTQRLFGARRYEIDFPLKHPMAVLPDRSFEKRAFGRGKILKLVDKIESAIRRKIYR